MPTSHTLDETPVTNQVGAVQPQFTLIGGALVQLATTLANAIKTRRQDATPSQGEKISSGKIQEEEDESYIPNSSQRQKTRESVQLGSPKNKSIPAEDDGESRQGKKYALYRTPSNPRTSSQQGTHIQKGCTETVYPQTDSQATARESGKAEKQKEFLQ